ncbi:MAG: hypothetical protein ACE5KV_02270 [Thermoplasmata archaeon]
MKQIVACMNCGGTELNAIFSARGAFVGSYHCLDCDGTGPAIIFDDLESYEKFKRSLEEKRQ